MLSLRKSKLLSQYMHRLECSATEFIDTIVSIYCLRGVDTMN